MRFQSTDVLSLAAIAFGATIGIGVTTLVVSAAEHRHHHHDHDHDVLGHVETIVAPAPAAAPQAPVPPAPAVRPEAAVEPAPAPEPGSGRLGIAAATPAGIHADPIVYIDGVRVEGRDALSGLRPSRIDRVEVIKGPAAVQVFGEEARERGVIQIFLKDSGSGG